MNLMQLIKLVLDDAYAAIVAPDDATKDAQIKVEMTNLSAEYGNLTSKACAPIDYSNAVKRFAYIYKYTVAHADYIMQLIKASNELRELLDKRSIEVACLGGGPGSDLLGILKFLIQTGAKDLSLKCYIFDKERAWGTDATTWASYQKFLRADLFTLSYFLSEVWKIKDAAEPFFEHCLSQMKSGSMILFVDNNDSRFRDWFDAMSKRHKLVVIESAEGELCFSNDEEKDDLGVYFRKFGWPKRKSDAAWRIMAKG